MSYLLVDMKMKDILKKIKHEKLRNSTRDVGNVINYIFPPEMIPDAIEYAYTSPNTDSTSLTGMLRAKEEVFFRWELRHPHSINPGHTIQTIAYFQLRLFSDDITKPNNIQVQGSCFDKILDTFRLTHNTQIMFDSLSTEELSQMFADNPIDKLKQAWRPVCEKYISLYERMPKRHSDVGNLIPPYTVEEWDSYDPNLGGGFIPYLSSI